MSATAAPTAESLLRFQTLEDQVVNLTRRVDSLRAENLALKRSSAKSEKDAHEFVAYFQREMEKKDSLIGTLNRKLTSATEELEHERHHGQKEHEAKLAEIRSEHAAANKKLQMRLDVAEDELTVLGEFKSVKADLLSKLNAAREELEAERQKHREELSSVERKSIEEKTRLRHEQELKIREIKRRSREEAQEGLSADTRTLISDNKRMGEELRFQLQTSDELERERNKLAQENTALKRECSLYAEKEAEYAKQGYKKEKQLKIANESVRSLEKSLANIVQKFEKEKMKSEENRTNAVSELEMECNGLRSLVRLKNKELRNIRSLAQEILNQRTEVEAFFLDALNQVKQEKLTLAHEKYQEALRQRRIDKRVKEHQRKVKGIADEDTEFMPLETPSSALGLRKGSPIAFPYIGGGTLRAQTVPNSQTRSPTSQAVPEKPVTLEPSDKIDLKDLDADDRERVLRLLFAKINAVQTRVSVLPNQDEANEQGNDESKSSRTSVAT